VRRKAEQNGRTKEVVAGPDLECAVATAAHRPQRVLKKKKKRANDTVMRQDREQRPNTQPN
jgi:hypothetical protein